MTPEIMTSHAKISSQPLKEQNLNKFFNHVDCCSGFKEKEINWSMESLWLQTQTTPDVFSQFFLTAILLYSNPFVPVEREIH